MRAAIYSRFSTDRQNESSIADQVRVCSEHAAAQGWTVAATFEDQGISGAAMGNRPGLLALLDATNARTVEVVIVTDLSRLSRSNGDLSKMIDRLVARGVRVIGVQDGYDSTRRGHKLQAGLSGIIGEAFRDMVKERTYTALETRARQQRPTGGKAYGYRNGGIVEAEAAIVREVFEAFASGQSARRIADSLNARSVPSPGSSWNRTERRCGGWLGSGIRAMLLNDRYRGRVIWNRTQWVKDPDTGARRCVQRPEAEWIVHADESQRIVSDELWSRVAARMRGQTEVLGERVRAGLARAKRTGRKPKFLYSSLLVCGDCGAKFVIADRTHYACSSRVNGGPSACRNDARFKRTVVEDGLIEGVKIGLRDPELVRFVQQRVRELVKAAAKAPAGEAKRVAELEAQVANLTDAIASGALRTSPALAARLSAAEAELERLRAAAKPVGLSKVERLIPQVADRFLAFVDGLSANVPPEDVDRVRAELRGLHGPITVVATPEEIRFETQKGRVEAAFLRAAGGTANNVVAGACFSSCLLRLPRN